MLEYDTMMRMFRKRPENFLLLQEWMDDIGRVDYEGLEKDSHFKALLGQIETVDVVEMEVNEELVFWLNAYNVMTIKGVLIELEKNISWNGNLGLWNKIKFFYLRRFSVGGKKLSLYSIENHILRKKYRDPRIHFAINCGSVSCPRLPPELFSAENLNSLLDQLIISFVNDQKHVHFDVETRTLFLNPIFKWYRKDFNVVGGVIAFIQRYTAVHEIRQIKGRKSIRIRYFPYDWSLNSR